jgi:hypothetical protein
MLLAVLIHSKKLRVESERKRVEKFNMPRLSVKCTRMRVDF